MTWELHPINEFSRHAAQWDQLCHACNHPAFLESAFLLPLLAEFGDGQEQLALNHERGQLLAGAIVRRCGKGRWETFQPSQLPLGAWLATLNSGLATQAAELLTALPGVAVVLGVTQQDSQLQARPADGPVCRTQDYIDTAWVNVSGTFDNYWDSLGKNLRQNTKKQRNKLAAEGIEPRLECITDVAQVGQAMQDYGALESAGWKASDGTAIHPDNAQGRFYRQMLENYCAKGQGRIYRYWFGDKVVSMDLCIDSGPAIIILKTTYDESYKNLSPSTLMRHEQFQRIFEEGRYQRIEFFGKVMEWHTRWTSLSRPLFQLTLYRWPLVLRVRRLIGQRPSVQTSVQKQPETR